MKYLFVIDKACYAAERIEKLYSKKTEVGGIHINMRFGSHSDTVYITDEKKADVIAGVILQMMAQKGEIPTLYPFLVTSTREFTVYNLDKYLESK